MNGLDNLKQVAKQNLRDCQLKQVEILETIDAICRANNITYWLDGGTLLGAVRHKGFIPWDDDIDIAMGKDDLERFIRIAEQQLPAHLKLQAPRKEDCKENLVKIRDLNSLYIEKGDDFGSMYEKGIFVDIFPFTNHPKISIPSIKKLSKAISKSSSILHHKHHYSLRSFAEFFWFGAKYMLCKVIWNVLCRFLPSERYANTPETNGYGITHAKTTVLPVSEIEFEGKMFCAPADPDRYLRDIYNDYEQLPPVDKRVNHAIFILPKLV